MSSITSVNADAVGMCNMLGKSSLCTRQNLNLYTQMTQEDKDQIVAQLREAATEQKDLLEQTKHWTSPIGQAVAFSQFVTYTKLADIFSTLRTE